MWHTLAKSPKSSSGRTADTFLWRSRCCSNDLLVFELEWLACSRTFGFGWMYLGIQCFIAYSRILCYFLKTAWGWNSCFVGTTCLNQQSYFLSWPRCFLLESHSPEFCWSQLQLRETWCLKTLLRSSVLCSAWTALVRCCSYNLCFLKYLNDYTEQSC